MLEMAYLHFTSPSKETLYLDEVVRRRRGDRKGSSNDVEQVRISLVGDWPTELNVVVVKLASVVRTVWPSDDHCSAGCGLLQEDTVVHKNETEL